MSFMGERSKQACLSCYCLGFPSHQPQCIFVQICSIRVAQVLCCQFTLLSLPLRSSVPAAVTACHGVPQTEMWVGPCYPWGNLEQTCQPWVYTAGLPGLHNAVS